MKTKLFSAIAILVMITSVSASASTVSAQGPINHAGRTALSGSTLSPNPGEITSSQVSASAEPTVTWISQLGSTARDEANSIVVDDVGNIYVTGDTDFVVAGSQEVWLGRLDENGDDLCTPIFGSSGFDGARGIASDSAGNVYLTGFTPGPGSTDAWLAKYDSDCEEVWTRVINSGGGEGGLDVAVDFADNIYVSGWTNGALFGSNAGLTDAWLAKYNTSGTRLWGRQYGTADQDRAEGIVIDSNNNIAVTGRTAGSNEDDLRNVWLAKYSSSGSQLWTRNFGTPDPDWGFGVAVDSANNIYVTGTTDGDLGGTNAGGADGFLAKYSSSGSQQWLRQLGTASHDEALDIAVNSGNDIYLTGYTSGDLGDNAFSGGIDAWVAKYDVNGSRQWVHQLGTAAVDEARSIAIDGNNAIYLAGYTAGNWGGQQAGSGDAVVVKLHDSGAAAPPPQLVIEATGPGVEVNDMSVAEGNTSPLNERDKISLDGSKSAAELKAQCAEQIIYSLGFFRIALLNEEGDAYAESILAGYTFLAIAELCDQLQPTTSSLATTSPLTLTLTLQTGGIRIQVVEANLAFDVVSANAIVHSVGTNHFATIYDPDADTTTVICYSGTVTVEPTNAALPPFTLQTGDQVEVTDDIVGPITNIYTSRAYLPIVLK